MIETLAPPIDLNGFEPIERLHKDLREGIATLSPAEVRYLVDAYYAMQDYRIQAAGQVRASSASGEPHAVILWQLTQMERLENAIKRTLDWYTDREPTGMGAWAKEVVGIGPVLSAGLIAHIDITRAPTVGHIWRFAGLDPTLEWSKGQKRPFNAKLKVLCWKIGESFVKVSGNPKAFYGHLYGERKAQEIERNERGGLAGQAEAKLAKYKIGKETDAFKAYSAGKLPPAHIHARAKRYAVKLFLAHYWEEAYRRHFGTEPPLPYPIAHLGHVHRINPPN